MQNIIGLVDFVGFVVLIRHFKGCDVLFAIHPDQIVFKVDAYPVINGHVLQVRNKVRHAEQGAHAAVELCLYLMTLLAFLPLMGRQVSDFLRRARTFDGRGRLGKQGAAGLQAIDALPGVTGE